MAAPTIRGGVVLSNSSTGSATVTVQAANLEGTDPQVGDSICVWHAQDWDTLSTMLPLAAVPGTSGWFDLTAADAGENATHIKTYITTVTSAGPKTITSTGVEGDFQGLAVAVVYGTAGPIFDQQASSVSNFTSSSHATAALAVTSGANDGIAISAWLGLTFASGVASPAYVAPSGWTEEANFSVETFMGFMVASRARPAGSSNPATSAQFGVPPVSTGAGYTTSSVLFLGADDSELQLETRAVSFTASGALSAEFSASQSQSLSRSVSLEGSGDLSATFTNSTDLEPQGPYPGEDLYPGESTFPGVEPSENQTRAVSFTGSGGLSLGHVVAQTQALSRAAAFSASGTLSLANSVSQTQNLSRSVALTGSGVLQLGYIKAQVQNLSRDIALDGLGQLDFDYSNGQTESQSRDVALNGTGSLEFEYQKAETSPQEARSAAFSGLGTLTLGYVIQQAQNLTRSAGFTGSGLLTLSHSTSQEQSETRSVLLSGLGALSLAYVAQESHLESRSVAFDAIGALSLTWYRSDDQNWPIVNPRVGFIYQPSGADFVGDGASPSEAQFVQ